MHQRRRRCDRRGRLHFRVAVNATSQSTKKQQRTERTNLLFIICDVNECEIMLIIIILQFIL